MNDISIVTAKVDAGLKLAAQSKAREIGIPISAVIKEALRDFVAQKKYSFDTPSQELIDHINEARVEYKRGETVGFPAKEAVEGLRKLLDED
jgi:antitoxin component of RelBE/YafQ-DinJ toxin-antitoxin module